MNYVENGQECVNNYECVFQACEMPASGIIKAKVIQALIQIERPTNWNREKLIYTIKDLINVERYNASVSRTINKFIVKWNQFKSISHET
jgi:hypothetical protein